MDNHQQKAVNQEAKHRVCQRAQKHRDRKRERTHAWSGLATISVFPASAMPLCILAGSLEAWGPHPHGSERTHHQHSSSGSSAATEHFPGTLPPSLHPTQPVVPQLPVTGEGHKFKPSAS